MFFEILFFSFKSTQTLTTFDFIVSKFSLRFFDMILLILWIKISLTAFRVIVDLPSGNNSWVDIALNSAELAFFIDEFNPCKVTSLSSFLI